MLAVSVSVVEQEALLMQSNTGRGEKFVICSTRKMLRWDPHLEEEEEEEEESIQNRKHVRHDS